MTLYPMGYGTQMVSLEFMYAIHAPKMHPEYARRLFAWLEAQGGAIGIGGGWRPTPSNTSPASMRGESFHQDQQWASGLVRYAAVDLVHTDGPDADNLQDGVSWAMVPAQGSVAAQVYGVHCNVGAPGVSGGEPWHMQPIEIDGWQSWVNAGRPDPQEKDLNMTPENPNRRIYDSGGRVPAGQIVAIDTGRVGRAVQVNLTVADTEGPGFLTAWGGLHPPTSNLNWDRAGAIISNTAAVPTEGRTIRLQSTVACRMVVDLQGVHP